MTDSDVPSLKSLADELCAALQSYVTVLTTRTEPESVLPAMDAVQAAAARFVDASITETGWGTPFLPSPFPDDDGEDTGTGEEDGTVAVTVTHIVRCLDPGLARHVVTERIRATGEPDTEYEIDSVGDMLLALQDIDGWDPQRYQAFSRNPFEVLEKFWSYTQQ